MRVVLFGGGGFIGRHLAAALSARGHHVIIATRHREAVKNDLILLPNTDVIACDYNQAQTVHPMLEGADAAVNLIGILNERDKGEFERVHCELTRILVAGALAHKVRRFIHISALGASASAPSAYLRSKAKAEQALKDIIGMRTVIMRPSVVFGSGDSFVTFFAKLTRRLPFCFYPAPIPSCNPSPLRTWFVCWSALWKTAIATEKFCLWAALISCLYPTLSPKLLTLAVIPAE